MSHHKPLIRMHKGNYRCSYNVDMSDLLVSAWVIIGIGKTPAESYSSWLQKSYNVGVNPFEGLNHAST